MELRALPIHCGTTRRITYWGINDLLDGEGTQNGYFNNIHPDGGRDFGTFEGKVNATDGSMTVEGSFKFTGGDGKYSDITGAEPLRPLQNQKPRSKPPGQTYIRTGESTVSLTPRIERSYNFKLIVLSWENVSSTRRGILLGHDSLPEIRFSTWQLSVSPNGCGVNRP